MRNGEVLQKAEWGVEQLALRRRLANNGRMTISPTMTMSELVSQFPGAQRALFRAYHIGGCSSCGFRPDETLAEVCVRNENLPVAEVIQTLQKAQEADENMEVSVTQASELM